MIRHFQKENLEPARTFYERELGKLSRPDRKGWALGNCIFHPSKSKKSFSVNLVTGAFHCFGCDVHGSSIVSFTMLRDGTTFKHACQSLGCWDEAPSPATVRKMAQAELERNRAREQAVAVAELDRRRRLAIREQLHAADWAYTLVSERLSQLRQGATPDWPEEEEACWSTLQITAGDLRTLDSEYCQAAGLEHEG